MEATAEIAILLATYNGEKYISEQLDSLLKQSYSNFMIVIRDDGSNDSTLKIINEYIKRYPNKISLLHDDCPHRGAKNGFLHLLEKVNANYYMFCDQDDVWLPDKVELSILKLKELESIHPGKAVMVHTDLAIVNKNLEPIYNSLWDWAGFNVDLNRKFNYAVMGNVFTGCTMIFNSIAKSIIFPVHPKSSMHDEWIGLVIAKYGIIDNIKKQTILYRQHGKNVCSTGEKKDFSKQRFSFKILYQWYYDNIELLTFLNYGSVFKAIFYKILYLIKRRFR